MDRRTPDSLDLVEWRPIGVSGLEIACTDTGEGAVFEAFFKGYDRAFVLPNEKEDIEGFRACLALNHGDERARLEAEYGPFRELCLIARDCTGTLVGGANLIALRLDVGGARPLASANLNYCYVEPEARGRGHLRRLVEAVSDVVARTMGVPRPLIFIEQNDPFAMSAEAYRHDSEFTGLDQLDRLRIWARMGARIVDFDYVQPPLSPEQEPDNGLVYAVLGAQSDTLPACVLAKHLRSFFGISVLKGAPLENDPTARTLLAQLDSDCVSGRTVGLLDSGPMLTALGRRDDAVRLLGTAPGTLRKAIGLI